MNIKTIRTTAVRRPVGNLKIINAYLVRPADKNGEKLSGLGELYVKDGLFHEKYDGPFDEIIDAGGKAVFPGFIDCHVHLREPGQEYKEDLETGSLAAAAGGFTSICCMPNTTPTLDNDSLIRDIYVLADEKAVVNVFPIGAVSKKLQGEELAEIGLMKDAGIVAISDDGGPVKTAALLKKAMLYASDFDLTILDHCEDLDLAAGGVMNEGSVSEQLGVKGIPSVAEDIHIARDILLADYLSIPIHICHVSTKRGTEMLRAAKARGVKVTAETCPHYFSLTDEACLGYNALARVNPPLRTKEDQEAIILGLKDGTLDMLVTDHAPHHEDEKINIEFSLANNGMLGLETAFSLAYEILVLKNSMDLEDLLRILCIKPNALVNLGRGSFAYGSPADFNIIDLEQVWTVDRFKLHSRSKNSPYHGMELHGKVVATYVNGGKVYEQ